MPELSRRSILALAVGGFAMAPMRAFSQEEDFQYDGILPFIWDAPVVRDLVVQPEFTGEQTIHYVGRDFHSRSGLVAAAHLMGAFETRAQAARYLDDLAELGPAEFVSETLASQMNVIDGLLAENLPLIPRIGSVQPVRLAMVEPPPPVRPDDRTILGRILADTLEIDPDDLPDSEALDDSDRVTAMLDEMQVATEKEDWPRLADQADRLLRRSVTANRLAAIRPGARPRVLYNLATGCVPLLGWTYMSARLVASIRRNRHRFSFS